MQMGSIGCFIVEADRPVMTTFVFVIVDAFRVHLAVGIKQVLRICITCTRAACRSVSVGCFPSVCTGSS